MKLGIIVGYSGRKLALPMTRPNLCTVSASGKIAGAGQVTVRIWHPYLRARGNELVRSMKMTRLGEGVDESGVLSHGEMSTGVGGLIMLATPTPDYEGPRLHASHCSDAAAWTAAPWVIDGCTTSMNFFSSAGRWASMLSGIESGPGGSRLYRAEDVEGHRWMFMQRSAG